MGCVTCVYRGRVQGEEEKKGRKGRGRESPDIVKVSAT